MSEAKLAKPNAAPVGLPNYEIPKFDMPKTELTEAFREMAKKGVAQAKDAYEKVKAATEEASDLLKDTFAATAKGAADYNLMVIEIARTNINIAFDYAKELSGVKSLTEFVELSTAHARKQFEAITAQTKELTELAQKVTTEIAAKNWRHGDTNASNKLA
jgi:phasin